MPELPEVENVVRGIRHNKKILKAHLVEVETFRSNLRYDIPLKELIKLVKSDHNQLLQIERRAKYILFKFKDDVVISHLGMTGSWRFGQNIELKKHDHLRFRFSSGEELVYNDPRRFGHIYTCLKNKLSDVFLNLGYEPLDLTKDQLDLIYAQFQSSHRSIKTLIMDQKILVGVGNIYACEALYLAKVSPLIKGSDLQRKAFNQLMIQIHKLLLVAIKRGGSSIKNYRKADNSEGGFQHLHQVYGREKMKCKRSSNHQIERIVQEGRSTFYCSTCQSS